MAHRIGTESVVLVTGSSAGIGEAVALRLADRGVRLALAARGMEALEAVAAACRDRGAEALAVPTDVADEAQCRALVAATMAAYGRLDALVNTP